MKFDLQLHSTASDGEFSPRELVRKYKQKKFEAIAICDHDTVKGTAEALRAGKKYKLRVISGIEMSAEHNKTKIHILGLGIDHTNKPLKKRCQNYHIARIKRAKIVVKELQKLGFKINYSDVAKSAGGAVTRTHISTELQRRKENKKLLKKYISKQLTTSHIIQGLMTEGKPAYVTYPKRTAKQDIKLIHEARGLAILSHPYLISLDHPKLNIEKFLRSLERIGLDGIEAYAASPRNPANSSFAKLAKKLGLLVSAGSDFHGKMHNHKLGTFSAPKWVWENLAEHFDK